MISVAIDGPAGAGKSTISRIAADKLGFVYVDTGALYRAIGWYVRSLHRDPGDAGQVCQSLNGLDIALRYTAAGQRVLVNGADVSDAIRTPEVSMAASAVSAIPAVRDFLLELQRSMAREQNVIMDGRDIGTVVLPGATLKIFLTASPEDRARRRYEELRQKGQQAAYADVLADLKQRDYQDSHRAVAPLQPAADSVLVDTTGNTLEQSVELLVSTICEKLQIGERFGNEAQ